MDCLWRVRHDGINILHINVPTLHIKCLRHKEVIDLDPEKFLPVHLDSKWVWYERELQSLRFPWIVMATICSPQRKNGHIVPGGHINNFVAYFAAKATNDRMWVIPFFVPPSNPPRSRYREQNMSDFALIHLLSAECSYLLVSLHLTNVKQTYPAWQC